MDSRHVSNSMLPSCEVFLGASGSNRYGMVFPNNRACKRKLFVEDEIFEHPISNYHSSHATDSNRIVFGNGISQIAIRKKYNDSPTGFNNEVLLLNGNWDTSHGIPNIVAEMHNVNVADLQCTWGNNEPMGLMTAATRPPPGTALSKTVEMDADHQDYMSDDNFSWLVNFKLDDLIHAATPVANTEIPNGRNSLQRSSSTLPQQPPSQQSNYNNQSILITDPYFTEEQLKTIIQENKQQLEKDKLNGTTTLTVKAMKAPSATVNLSQQPPSYRYSGPRKPPFTYTELIQHALREKGELTVSGIYQWISDHFPFYKANDDRWKNSVRHNLSINPHFRKGSKAVHGAGHLWTIAQRDDSKMGTWIMKKQRMQQFIEKYDDQEKAMDDELQAATASIMPSDINSSSFGQNDNQIKRLQNGIRQSDDSSGNQLNVEVQYLIPVGEDMDFMCPVSKEQVAEECGLQSCHSSNDKIELAGDYLITDLNPQTLGLNLSEAEIITTDQLFGDDLSFQCYELQV